MTTLYGHDRYSGSSRAVTVSQDRAHVSLSVDCVDGDAEVLLTPAQAITVASWLLSEADIAGIIEGDDQP